MQTPSGLTVGWIPADFWPVLGTGEGVWRVGWEVDSRIGGIPAMARLACLAIEGTSHAERRRETGRVLSFRHGLRRLAEDELIRLAKARNFDAFEELITRHRRLICDVCVRLTVSGHDAEDAVQAVQLAVWQGIGSFEGASKFSTWLYRVACNTTHGLTRRRVPVPVEQIPERVADGEIDRRVADVQAVRWALARLPEEYRTTLILKECMDLSVEEIAEIQIISVGTVKSRLSRARHAVAAMLSERDT